MAKKVIKEQEAEISEQQEIEKTRKETEKNRILFYEAEKKNFATDETGAQKIYKRIIKAAPDSLYGYLSAGQISVINSAKETALNQFLLAQQAEQELLQNAIIDQPEDSVKIHLGLTYRKLNKFDEAVEILEQVNPNDRKDKNAFAYVAIASAYRARYEQTKNEGCGYKALSFAKEALKLDPELYDAQTVELKLLEIKSEKNPRAKEEVVKRGKEILSKNPKGWYATGIVASTLFGLGRIDEAIKFYQIAVENSPSREVFAQVGLAGLQMKAAPEESKKMLQHALSVNPKNTRALFLMEQIFRKEGNLEEAKKLHETLKKIKKARSEAEQPEIATIDEVSEQEQESLPPVEIIEAKEIGAGGPFLQYANNATQRTETHDFKQIVAFLDYVLKTQKLPIGEKDGQKPAPIDVMGKESVFLVAKTGVGKTVTVPTKILIAQCEEYFAEQCIGNNQILTKFPQVFVVVPRIPIANSQMDFMNSEYQNFLSLQNIRESRMLYGCINSARGKVNDKAPILFVTTGIFCSMAFNDQLDPSLHRIIIDEAHVTIEQNPEIEMSIAIARKKKVKIDYMSATVDTGTLKEDLGVKIVTAGKERFPIYMVNLPGNLEDHLVEIIKDYLLDPQERLFPKRNDPNFGDVAKHLLDEKNRARGMLVIINSYAGDESDVKKYSELIAKAPFNQDRTRVPVFAYASPIARSASANAAFKEKIAAVEAKNGVYVIISTNVVEMGVTFDSLDYVVTLDSEMVTTIQDGGGVLDMAPLGVNALFQRIGRVGRKRAGMAFIAKDYGAEYTKLSDKDLNRNREKSLPYEKIDYPIQKGSLQKLALYSFKEEWKNPEKDLAQFGLPSFRNNSRQITEMFLRERAKIQRMGLANGTKLTELGKTALGYLNVESMDYKRLLALAQRESNKELGIIVLALAASADFGLSRYLQSGITFPEGNKDDPNCLIINRIIELWDCRADLGKLKEALDNASPDQLQEKLTQTGIAHSDSVLIAKLFAQGFQLEDIEQPETEGDEMLPTFNLSLKKTAIMLDRNSELVTMYNLIRYFYNNFFSRMDLPGITQSQREQIGEEFQTEAMELGLNPKTISAVIKNMRDLARYTNQAQKTKLLSVKKDASTSPIRPDDQSIKDALSSALIWRSAEIKQNTFINSQLEVLAGCLIDAQLERPKPEEIFTIISPLVKKLLPEITDATLKMRVEDLVSPALRNWKKEIEALEYDYIPPSLPVLVKPIILTEFLDKSEFGEVIELHTEQNDQNLKGELVGSKYSETLKRQLPVVLGTLQTSLGISSDRNKSAKYKIRALFVPDKKDQKESEKDAFARGGKRLAAKDRKQFRIFRPIHVQLA